MKIFDLEYLNSLSECGSLNGGAIAYASSTSISSSDRSSSFSGSSGKSIASGEYSATSLIELKSSSISYKGYSRGYSSSSVFSFAKD